MKLRVVGAGLALIALFAAVFVFVTARRRAPNATLVGTPLVPLKAARDATLIDAHGRPAQLLDARADATFVFFGYTHCPDECPIALASLGRAYRSLDAATRPKVRIVFVTVDPERDTPSALNTYVAHFDANVVALTGSRAQLAPVWKAYGVDVAPQARELVRHGGTIYGVDRLGTIVTIYPPDVTAAILARDAAALAAQSLETHHAFVGAYAAS